MGVVFLARDTRLGRRVAIKILTHENPTLHGRFLAEARATARCKHNNIVIIHDVGEARGYSYMVLEYLQGQTLRDWLEDSWRFGRVSVAQALDIITPVARALDHAHAQGMVHRDLKPDNIMLTDSGALKVLDFGIAKLRHSPSTVSKPGDQSLTTDLNDSVSRTGKGALVGTMPYMAPEQLRGEDVDERCDIWAVGIILWKLCTGKHPLAPITASRLMALADGDTSIPSIAEQRTDLGPLADIINHCLEIHLDKRLASAAELLAAFEPLAVGQRSVDAAEQTSTDNPYVGLAAFQEGDSARFFGRDPDIARLLHQLRNRHLIAVVGASGSGKSSLIRAGVIPALKRSGQSWETFITRPGREPLAAMAEILLSLTHTQSQTREQTPDAATREQCVAALREQPGYLGTVMRARARKRQSRTLLFIDQFEELYTMGADRATRAAFVACLEGVADDASSPLRIMLSVRSDFLDRVAEDRAFTNGLTAALTLLSPLDRAQLHAALTEPLAPSGAAFEHESLLASMLDALQATRAPLPLLQFTAAQLWENRDPDSGHITRACYDALGGVEGALASHADAVLASMTTDERKLTRAVCTALVSDERTRAIVSLDELRTQHPADQREAVEACVQRLARARLVLIENDERGATAELVHESLIERWPALVRWLDEEQDAGHFLARLQSAARQWHGQARSEDLLWRGQAAREAARFRERADHILTDLGERERDYLHAVIAYAQRAQRRRQTVRLTMLAVTSAIALLVSLLALRADRHASRADQEARLARASEAHALASTEEAARRAAQARNASRLASAALHRSDPTLVLALVREMEDTVTLPPQWRELARWAMQQDMADTVILHPDDVYAADISPDGQKIVTASRDGMARIWNVTGVGEPLLLSGHEGAVRFASFSPDGAKIVTASFDRTARVWNASDGAVLQVLEGHQDELYTAGFDPDGSHIVTASLDRTARVWSTGSSSPPRILRGHQGFIYTAAFSPDGSSVVTASWDKTARIWPLGPGGEPRELRGHSDRVTSAAFHPDGSRVVTSSWDKTVRVWNVDDASQIRVLHGHQDRIAMARFSPDGTRVISASWDGTARVWTQASDTDSRVLRGHQEKVYSALFSADGAQVVTAALDKSVRVWNIAHEHRPRLLKGHRARLYSAAFSANNERVVTASLDGTARVWNADGTGNPVVLRGHDGRVYAASFSPDGEQVVTASIDKTAKIWRTDGQGQPVTLKGHTELVGSASFSPDGKHVVTASLDKTIRVWPINSNQATVVLRGHDAMVYSAVYSPDGSRIASASWDKTARIWQADGSGERLLLHGHEAQVSSVAFSPDGTRVLTTSFDKTARIWHLEQIGTDGAPEFTVLGGHGSIVGASSGRDGRGAWSPDGKRVLTISNDKTLRIWSADGVGKAIVLQIPEVDAYSAAFSPDGKHIVTTSHSERNPVTGEMVHWATVWPTFQEFTGLDDPVLWTATRFCPPVELRKQLLGVPDDLAREHFQQCNVRVKAAFDAKLGQL